ncbi:hypothetical protein [Halomonas nitroreducens]|uniref:hypothetical protein n=1 Tax=Halomonas nitroreducens TaxID=447425 RepID=UPI00163A8052|nr:hypothetical protein [Halomonas nitroreducens]
MPNHGGRYEIRRGKRVLVERTDGPQPDPRRSATPARKPAPKTDDVKESSNGEEMA